MDHDQRFKILIQTFFADFLLLFFRDCSSATGRRDWTRQPSSGWTRKALRNPPRASGLVDRGLGVSHYRGEK
jgi:hypothetical protein